MMQLRSRYIVVIPKRADGIATMGGALTSQMQFMLSCNEEATRSV